MSTPPAASDKETSLEIRQVQFHAIPSQASKSLQPRQIKDRNGCLNCKRRKVKCPDSNPECSRCLSRKEICERMTEAPSQWRITVPRQPKSISENRGIEVAGADWHLLDYWFNRSCRLLCNESENSLNPFSYSLLSTLSTCRSATHAVQSLSAAYKEAFQIPEMRNSLEERGRALHCLRHAISGNKIPTDAELFSIVIIGMSSAWFCNYSTDVGSEHLAAAHAAIRSILMFRSTEAFQSNLFILSAGLYIYWDMACSFAVRQDSLPTRDSRLMTIAKVIDDYSPASPVLGISTELFLILGSVGRYYRHILGGGKTNQQIEADLRQKLLDWTPSKPNSHLDGMVKIAECYRSTGLVVLEQLQRGKGEKSCADRVNSTFATVIAISSASPLFGFQTLVLAIIGSEISNVSDRRLITQRFFELYRYNRLPVNYQALELVQEAWKLRDAGQKITVLDLMHEKNLGLMLG